MRRLFLLLSFVILVFVSLSCDTKYYSVTVRNASSKSVTYSYDGFTDTLVAAASKEYQVKAYTQPPGNISVPGAMSVEMKTMPSGGEYVFEDITAINLNILNTLSTNVRRLFRLNGGKGVKVL
jgi:hypothetical protein